MKFELWTHQLSVNSSLGHHLEGIFSIIHQHPITHPRPYSIGIYHDTHFYPVISPIYIYICTHVYTYIYIYVCVHIYMYIYIWSATINHYENHHGPPLTPINPTFSPSVETAAPLHQDLAHEAVTSRACSSINSDYVRSWETGLPGGESIYFY